MEFSIVALLMVIVGWVISVCVHEYGHAIVAYKGGDLSVKDKGYLSGNPLKYTHPTTTILLPVLFIAMGGFALPGGAVYIDHTRLKNRHWDCMVSLAGPLGTILFLLVLMIPIWLGMDQNPDKIGFWAPYSFLCALQVMALAFNLIPIPPLDGFQAIGAYMKPEIKYWFLKNSNLFFFGLIALLWFSKTAHFYFFATIFLVAALLGVDPELMRDGYYMVVFR